MSPQQLKQKAIDEGRPSQYREGCKAEAERWHRIAKTDGGSYPRKVATSWEQKAAAAKQ